MKKKYNYNLYKNIKIESIFVHNQTKRFGRHQTARKPFKIELNNHMPKPMGFGHTFFISQKIYVKKIIFTEIYFLNMNANFLKILLILKNQNISRYICFKN